jgi:hypothetical protein
MSINQQQGELPEQKGSEKEPKQIHVRSPKKD